MATFRFSVIVTLGLLYIVWGNVLSKRAMRHLKEPVSIWLESPLVDQDLFTDEGKRLIRRLRLYYVLGALGLLLVGFLLKRIG